MAVDVEDLCSALGERAGDTVVVSDEVGLGVHPSSESGRRFRDAEGNDLTGSKGEERRAMRRAGRGLELADVDETWHRSGWRSRPR